MLDNAYLLEIARKFDFDELADEIDSLRQAHLTLNIGVLGEFSAGKSSLINALLGINLLPVADHPTTGSITIIEVGDSEQENEYLVERNGELEPISALDFQDYAQGDKEGRAHLRIRQNHLLRPGYRIVDTPGLSSLVDTHTSITYGELPQLDAAIICIPIAQGGVSKSLVDFLHRNEIKAIRSRFVYAICRADEKPKEAAEKIRDTTLKTLREVYEPGEWDALPEESRVVVTSAHHYRDTGNDSGLSTLFELFESVFVADRKAMEERRRDILLKSYAKQLHALLLDRHENLTIADHELREKEDKIAESIAELEEKRRKTHAKLQAFDLRLREHLIHLGAEFAPRFKKAEGEELAQVAESYCAEISATVERNIGSLAKVGMLPSFARMGAGIEERISNILRAKEIGVALVTSAAIALATGGVGLVANAAEGGAVAGGRHLALAGRQAALAAPAGAGAGGLAPAALNKTARFVGWVVKHINPFEYAGGFLADLKKSNVLDEELTRVAHKAADIAHRYVSDSLEEQVFEPSLQTERDKRKSLIAARTERQTSENARARLKSDISRERRLLEGMLG